MHPSHIPRPSQVQRSGARIAHRHATTTPSFDVRHHTKQTHPRRECKRGRAGDMCHTQVQRINAVEPWVHLGTVCGVQLPVPAARERQTHPLHRFLLFLEKKASRGPAASTRILHPPPTLTSPDCILLGACSPVPCPWDALWLQKPLPLQGAVSHMANFSLHQTQVLIGH